MGKLIDQKTEKADRPPPTVFMYHETKAPVLTTPKKAEAMREAGYVDTPAKLKNKDKILARCNKGPGPGGYEVNL